MSSSWIGTTNRSYSPITAPVFFDFFIAPNGDDNNLGTLASPWSITALNSKQSTYAGKKIGIIGDIAGVQTPIQHGTIGGVQTTLFSIYQGLTPSTNGGPNVLNVNGSSSGAPTYLASCNSSGVYTPRWAIIDGSQPGTGNLPTVEACLIGQTTFGSNEVANFGNATFDGLTVRNFTYSGMCFQGGGVTVRSGLTIKNCEVYGGTNVSSGNNPGAIWIGTYDSSTIQNCKIHDCVTTTGSVAPGGLSGIISFQCTNTLVDHCSVFNCGTGVYMKDRNQSGTIQYNYLDIGAFGSYGGPPNNILGSAVERACPGTGQILTVHHNICTGGLTFYPASANFYVSGTVNCFNNTVYLTANAPNAGRNFVQLETGTTSSPGASTGLMNFYSNLCYQVAGTINDTTVAIFNDFGITSSSMDYNSYTSGKTFFGSFQAPPGAPVDTTFATWQTTHGFDTHSIALTTSPFSGTPTVNVPSSFAISSSSPAFTGGITAIGGTTGQIQGACNTSGTASDGTGPIGCNF